MLLPFQLFPAFRCAADTPWGGHMLKSLFGKEIPDERTGESLEMSVIPGLDSTDKCGTALRTLIERDRISMLGTAVEESFPLLLKLIDAREQLSVQVHPDDRYARLHENKSGKAEAWVILKACPDSFIVYGLNPGVSKPALSSRLENGNDISDLLHTVPVKEKDVFYIPPGTVHAIGKGIVLYEIQQSSDITYRLYDWNRTDLNGNRRPLHIRQALDVTVPDFSMKAVIPERLQDPTCQRELLVKNRYFTLQRLLYCKSTPFYPLFSHFSVLTALSRTTLRQKDSDASLVLYPGHTLFVPAACEPFEISCEHCLLASP